MRKPRHDAHEPNKTAPKPIQSLLARYTNLKAPEGTVLTVLMKAAERTTGISLLKKDVRYAPGTRTIHLLCSGPKKHELLFRKSEILKACREELGEKSAPKAMV